MKTLHALSGMSASDLRTYLGDRESRKLAHNTHVEDAGDGDISIRFHTTRILTFHADGSFTLRTSGWRTPTTKQRLNALLPPGYRVWQKAYRWYISTPEGTFPFEDGDRWGAPARPAPRFQVGDRVRTFRGEDAVVTHVRVSTDPGKSHKVTVRLDGHDSDREFYEEVFSHAPHFHAGHNDAGYMPEADVATFPTYTQAADYLADEIDQAADSLETWADPHDCDDIPCPTFGDECAWQLAQNMRAQAAEIRGGHSHAGLVTYLSDGRSLPVAWWVDPCMDATCTPDECA